MKLSMNNRLQYTTKQYYSVKENQDEKRKKILVHFHTDRLHETFGYESRKVLGTKFQCHAQV